MVDETSNYRQEEITNDVFSILRNIYGFNLSEEALAEMADVLSSAAEAQGIKYEDD